MTLREKEIEAALKNCWVVILMDPDFSAWSPWSVIASDRETAIALARCAWREWLEEDEDEVEEDDQREDQDQEAAEAEVVKVYRNSWIGEIA